MDVASQSDVSPTTISIDGYSQGPKRTPVETAESEFVVDRDGSPLEHLLASLAACSNVIGHLVAKDRDFVIDELDVSVSSDLGARKDECDVTEPRAGFRAIRVDDVIDIDAGLGTLDAWLDDVTGRCPLADTLLNESTISKAVRAA